MGQRGAAGVASGAALEQAREPVGIGRISMVPISDPHHVAEEAVGGDAELQLVALAPPRRVGHRALEEHMLRLAGVKARKSWRPTSAAAQAASGSSSTRRGWNSSNLRRSGSRPGPLLMR